MANTLARQDNGQFQISFSIPQVDIKAGYKTALEHLSKDVDVAGFRKGKAPLDKVEQKLDKNDIYEHMIRDMLPVLLNNAVADHKLKPILTPSVRIVSSPEDGDWQFEAVSCEMPKIEVEKGLTKIKGLLKKDGIWTPGKDTDEKPKEPSEDEKLAKIFDALVEEVKVELPEILLKQEADRQLSELLDQIQKLGLTLEQYLSSTGKKVEDLRADYAKRASDQLKIEFVLAEVSKVAKIEVKKEEIDQLIESTADLKLKESLQSPESRRHIELSLIKRKTVEYLLELAK